MTHIKVKTALKAGRITANHTRNTLRVRTALKAGRITANHARNALGDPYRWPRDPNAHVLSNDLVEEPHGVLALDRKVGTVVVHRSWTVRTTEIRRRGRISWAAPGHF